jgi:hypothetical protein
VTHSSALSFLRLHCRCSKTAENRKTDQSRHADPGMLD